jgi:hypothetical protein
LLTTSSSSSSTPTLDPFKFLGWNGEEMEFGRWLCVEELQRRSTDREYGVESEQLIHSLHGHKEW